MNHSYKSKKVRTTLGPIKYVIFVGPRWPYGIPFINRNSNDLNILEKNIPPYADNARRLDYTS